MKIYFIIIYLMFFLLAMINLFMIEATCINEMIFIFDWSILTLDPLMDLKFYFYYDYLSNLFILVVSLISGVVFLYSKSYMENDSNKNKFMFLTFFFLLSMFLVILSMDMLIILLGWDGLGLVSYFLIIHYNNDTSYYSGMVTILINRFGDVGIISFLPLVMKMNSFEIFILNNFLSSDNLVILFLLFASFTKSAQFPFMVWLPLAMAAPTPISSLVHSSTLVTAGIYLFIRFEMMFKKDSLMLFNIMIMILLTMMISGLSAFIDMDVKKVIAYSTMSQLGLMMMVVVVGNEIICFFHILTHAMFKSLLFLCSGVFIHESLENQDLRLYSSVYKYNKYIVSIFFICSLSLCGFPFLSGFYSKDLILEKIYSMNYNMIYVIILMAATCVTVSYSLRLLVLSSILGSNSNKMLYYGGWSKIYNGLFILMGFVIFFGTMISWLILEKFSFFYFLISIKMLNIMLLLLGGLFYASFYEFDPSCFSSVSIKYFVFSMSFLLNIYNFLGFKLFKKFDMYQVYIETFLEKYSSLTFSNYENSVNNLVMFFKFFSIMLIFLLYLLTMVF